MFYGRFDMGHNAIIFFGGRKDSTQQMNRFHPLLDVCVSRMAREDS